MEIKCKKCLAGSFLFVAVLSFSISSYLTEKRVTKQVTDIMKTKYEDQIIASEAKASAFIDAAWEMVLDLRPNASPTEKNKFTEYLSGKAFFKISDKQKEIRQTNWLKELRGEK